MLQAQLCPVQATALWTNREGGEKTSRQMESCPNFRLSNIFSHVFAV